jgi:hypothetical protein
MSSDSLWKRDANGVEHPTHEALLAFIREQCTEREKNHINEHLLAGCAPCNRLHTELKQSSNTLNHLKYMSRYLYYPELQSNQVLLHIQRGEPLTSAWTGKRKRKFQVRSRPQIARRYVHKKSMRIVSLPAAFALFLLFMTAVIVLAYTVVNSGLHIPLPWQQPGGFHFDPGPNTSYLAPHTTPTPTNTVLLTVTPTPLPSPSVTVTTSPTPTVPVVKGPAIDFCPPRGYSGPIIVICGYGFKAGDKVSLVLDLYGSNTPGIEGSYRVDRLGKFTAYLYFYQCSNVPKDIYARDDTLKSAPVVSNTLTHIPVVGCRGPGPTPTPSVTPGGRL